MTPPAFFLRLAAAAVGVVFLVLAGCSARTLDVALPAPIPLSFPAPIPASARLQALAESVKGAYVRVHILDDSEDTASASGEPGTGTVNGGSGTIVTADGYVVTAAHIALATRFRAEVTTLDGRVHPARILSVHPGRELALLKMNPSPLPPPPRFADMAKLRAGEPVLAIGTPSNKKGVVSFGVVKRPHFPRRVHYGRYGYDNAIELRMAINPGHSGGPVFNGRGELIGIIGSFAIPTSRRRTPLALAFAVPVDAIAAFVEEQIGRRLQK